MAQQVGDIKVRLRDGGAGASTRNFPTFSTQTDVSSGAFRSGSIVGFAAAPSLAGQITGVATNSAADFTSGYISTAVTNNATTTTRANNIIGFAGASNIGADTNLGVPVTLAYPGTEFAVQVWNTSAATSVPTTDMVGVSYQLSQWTPTGGTGVVVALAKNQTSNGIFVVTHVPEESINEPYGFVYGRFVSTVLGAAVA